ncbi:outer membrane beta-barrel protein [Pontibacter harenae]|uniref:outer membrane beta-barrel protein n=1 Tax=Pontibacter harenae TaxID=2894083 RepID=UPI001E50E055|nr:outer membrane beta-barrel protein [Pontibacter harenae]MCC9168198.1 outer membrane beta-barrel protein [Pontibacter harenae]
MKKTLFTVALCCVGLVASAQQSNDQASRVSLQMGMAFPSGDFKSTELSNIKSGYAHDGVFISASYTQDLNKNFGVGATWAYRNHPFNIAPYAEKYEAYAYEIEADPYVSIYATIDAYAQLPLNKFTAYAKGSAGYGAFRPAALSGTVVYENGSTLQFSSDPGRSGSGVYGIAGGVRYNFGHFGLGAELGMIAAKPEFNVVIDGEVKDLKQPMHTTNLSLALSYRLN